MKSLLTAVMIMLAVPAVHAKVTIGAVLSTPEIFGGYLSIWPNSDISIDIRPTLSTIDAGITGHIRLDSGLTHHHDLLAQVMAGYVHAGDEVYYAGRGPRILGALGYGYVSAWDIRLLGGVTSYEHNGWWQTAPTFMAWLGHTI